MKYMNKSMMLVAGGMLALASCTEYSDYNSVPEDSNLLANKTLMENISENEQLQDFVTIINKAGCSEILNNPRVFTLWAPLDGTYDATPYLNMDSTNVMDKFIKQHLAEYSYQVVGEVDLRVATMNSKHHNFTNTSFDDAEIKTVNIPASNGVMHILNGVSEYHPNIYEYLDIVEGCDSFADYIHKYDIYTIDEAKSVIGPMVNGKQTYKDTVWTKSNPAMRTILHADLENEDSTYTLLLPTNAAWDKVKDKMSKSYNYITGFKYLDVSKLDKLISNMSKKDNIPALDNSDKKIDINPVFLKDTLMKANILRNLVYSNTDERNAKIVSGEKATVEDTLFSTSSNKVTSINEFIEKTIGDKVEMSNGYVRQLSEIGYYPWESYEPILKIRRPDRSVTSTDMDTKTKKGEEVRILQTKVTDDMWGEEFADGKLDFLKVWLMPKSSSYLTYFGTDIPLGRNQFVEMDYYLKGAMATKYRVYVVTVPESLNDTEVTNKKNAKRAFAFSMHTDEGKSTIGFYNNNNGTFDNVVFKSDTGIKDYTAEANSKIHAVEFDIDVPICYSNTDAAPVLFIQSYATGQNQNNFDKNLRIAGVFCVPESASEYVKTLRYEKK